MVLDALQRDQRGCRAVVVFEPHMIRSATLQRGVTKTPARRIVVQDLLVPIGARAANGLRADKYKVARQKGYSFPTYVSSRALTWPEPAPSVSTAA